MTRDDKLKMDYVASLLKDKDHLVKLLTIALATDLAELGFPAYTRQGIEALDIIKNYAEFIVGIEGEKE